MMTREELLKVFRELQSDNYDDCNNCDYCYDCYDCTNCYDCYDCTNCDYCYSCHNCYNCNYSILCKGLKNKKTGFWLLNEKVSQEEFEEAKKALMEE